MSDHLEEKREVETLIRASIPQGWNKLQRDERDRLVKTVRGTLVASQQRTSIYSGPIPSPEMLGGFNDVMENGADRVMRMAEAQSAHRISIEAKTVASQNRQGECGQIFAMISVLALIAAGVWTTLEGHAGVGATVFGTTIVGVATAFILGKSSMKKDLAKKSKDN
ncbi:MAG: DUF2335 domain-containing protein [Luteolibacter sp.]|uniref:DUF2335 domain-containing protein n=1 Tax=Luteolibacter sp. TaxID=1962973 RepID=UPI003264B83C